MQTQSIISIFSKINSRIFSWNAAHATRVSNAAIMSGAYRKLNRCAVCGTHTINTIEWIIKMEKDLSDELYANVELNRVEFEGAAGKSVFQSVSHSVSQ